MGSKRRCRTRRPARASAHLDPKPRILVVCEGTNTEPQYVNGFRRWIRNPRVDVEISREHGVPLTLVRKAKAMKKEAEERARRGDDENIAYDQVWCVFDVDDHPNLNDAKVMAKDNGILCAISSPCFELWLLLHFRDNPGMQHRRDINRMLVAFIPDYDKGIKFEQFKAGYADAVVRAERMDQQAAEVREDGRNPTTNVYQLTRSIER